jgi:hypothetical protein
MSSPTRLSPGGTEYVFLRSRFHLLVVADVDDGLLPLAGRDLALEENVDFSVRSVLHLRKPDVGTEQTEGTSSGPDVTTLATKVGTLENVC